MKRKRRGEYGYISYRKKTDMMWTLLMTVIGILIFVIGLFLNDMSNKNVFTIFGILMVLPAAKFLTTFIVVFPFKTPDAALHEKMESLCKKKENVALLSDLVITSPEKVMNLDFVVITENAVFGYTKLGKEKAEYMKNYLQKWIANQVDGCKVNIYTEEKKFLSNVNKIESKGTEPEKKESIKSQIRTLII